MTTIGADDMVTDALDRRLSRAPGTLEVIEYRRGNGTAVRRALLIRDVAGLLAAAGMSRLARKDD